MKIVFHAWLYGRFIEIQSKPRKKKRHRTNQEFNFLGGRFNNRNNVRAPIQLRRESQPQHLKRSFFLKNRPIPFISITLVLLDWSNKTSSIFPALKSTSHFLYQSIKSHRSDSSSGVNSNCYHRSDA